MAVFKYKGKTVQGKMVQGEITGESKSVVMAELRRQAIIPVQVKKKATEISIKIPGLGHKIKEKDIIIFTRQFSTMIDAGLPLVQSLEILAQQTENPALANCLKEVKMSVEGGSTFAEALHKYPQIFDRLYVNMVEAGEAGGILDTILNRLAGYIERAMSLRKKVKSAMTYPIVIMVVAIVVVAGLLIFVIPQFAELFVSFGGTLPLPTRIVIAASNFLGGWGGGIIAFSLITFFFVIKKLKKTEKGRLVFDTLLLQAPIIGPLIRKVAVAKFTRTLGTLLSSGVPLLDGMDITARTAGNKVIENAVMTSRTSISEGKTIAEPLEETGVFPPMVTQMIAIGENTGALDTMLSKIADFYDEEVNTAVETLTSMLEPMLMVFLGGTVGFILIAMYMPIFKLASLIS
ncbi:type II secretion system F family protein [bacterium]|nr:type II secretion system F family protein [bacterium]